MAEKKTKVNNKEEELDFAKEYLNDCYKSLIKVLEIDSTEEDGYPESYIERLHELSVSVLKLKSKF